MKTIIPRHTAKWRKTQLMQITTRPKTRAVAKSAKSFLRVMWANDSSFAKQISQFHFGTRPTAIATKHTRFFWWRSGFFYDKIVVLELNNTQAISNSIINKMVQLTSSKKAPRGPFCVINPYNPQLYRVCPLVFPLALVPLLEFYKWERWVFVSEIVVR